ncbi:hypothetical protein [Vulcanisaeta thermophila]|uniref:hypothetical protein n=1 Tax=Vulcanisaeta thermophila TaxID=867917 RepID=UPI001EE3347D|nr:hypothetical protein [Vulcanisaeta thermophila]
MADINKVLTDLKPGECALILHGNAAIELDGDVPSGVKVVHLRGFRDMTEVDYELARGGRVLCISNNGFGLLSEFALARLRFVIVPSQHGQHVSKLIDMLLNIQPT